MLYNILMPDTLGSTPSLSQNIRELQFGVGHIASHLHSNLCGISFSTIALFGHFLS